MIGRRPPSYQLVDENGIPILDLARKKVKWEHYIRDMFSDDLRTSVYDTKPTSVEGLPILKSEVLNALKRAKTGKSAGPDGIHIEVLKLLTEEHIDVLVQLFNLIYDTGQIPGDWLTSAFVTLPKKKNARKCEDFRTISLMSQVLKLFLSIIHERIREKCDEHLGDSQFGFRSGVGTREALFAIQVLIQKCRDMQQDVFLCFIDYEKAFDTSLRF